MAAKPIGTARVCCLMSNSVHNNKGIIKKPDGTPYNLGLDDFDEIKNAEYIRSVRLSLLAGEKIEECNTCWVKERMGGISRRMVSNRLYKDEFTEDIARKHTDAAGNTDWDPSYWDLRFGNLCNLKCVMCHPASSNQWYEEYVLINNETSFTDGGKIVQLSRYSVGRYVDSGVYNWWDNQNFWDRLRKKIPFLKQVYLVGGEPMLIEPHYDFLQHVVDSGRAGEVTLEYDTNLTTVNQRVLDLWKYFKEIKLRVSVDDIGNSFEYVRYPSKWNTLITNLHKLKLKLGNTVRVDFTVTWQLLTVLTTTTLLEFLSDNFPNSIVSVRILSSPDYFDVAILPKSVKIELLDLYKKFQEKYPANKIDHLIKYLHETLDSGDTVKLNECKRVLSILDRSRNTNWQELYPWLATV
jgi:organic radical activating enzyme